MKRYFIISLLSLLPALQVLSQELYTEKYRPQYHYTPASRWIGDPCGLMKHNGKYLAYCWGAAESTDLVHWTELNDNAITNLPKDIAPFTGSVVIDRNNTAGYGKNAAAHSGKRVQSYLHSATTTSTPCSTSGAQSSATLP